ncbi:MAG: PQQ-binding-like beta-propeller repeat protein [Verrucomicrobiota bacterium]|jgi:outer membrane protein assembly factor BamB
MTGTKTLTITTALAGMLAGRVGAVDWPQYRGPNHDGTSPETILTTWPSGGLRPIWKHPLHNGFSAITVGGGKAFTLVTREVEGADQEVCVALDANTGNELWAVPLGAAVYDEGGNRGAEDNNGGDGPRSTPAFDSGKVYTYSSKMVLKCLDAASGRQIWACDLIREHDGRNIHWESAASPVVEGELVLVAGGGRGQALLAFDKNDGHVVWKGQDDAMTQSTPVVATILDQRQVIFFTQKGLVSVVPTTGAVLWRYPYSFRVATAMTPVVSGDIVYCSAAYGVGSSACQISKTANGFEARRLWFQPANVLQSHWSTPVCSQGYLFGISGQAKFGAAPLVCVELATGKSMWSHEGFGPGGCTLVDGHVLVLSDAGDLVLVKATPAGYQEAGRSHVLAGKCWNSAGVSGGRIYARSTKEGVSVDVSVR